MQNKSTIAYILILLPIAIAIYFFLDSDALIPAGYDLAIDGFVISKTIMLIFTLYLLSKLGYHLLQKRD